MGKIAIDRHFDALVVNDFQKDFLSGNGNFAQPKIEIMSDRLVKILPLFTLSKVYFLIHRHETDLFKDYSNLRHCIIFPKIKFINPKNKGISEVGISEGCEFENNLSSYLLKEEIFKGNSIKRFFKLQCPLLGSQFSVLQVCKIDEHLLKNNIRRIFFTGLNFNPCIINEIAYLGFKNNFEIFVIDDLINSIYEKDKIALIESLKFTEVAFINSNDIYK